MSEHLTPLEVVQQMIGPVEEIGTLLSIDRKSPYGWRRGSKWHDAGDIPSTKYQRKLLAYARRRGIPLTADHLIFGADAEEVAQLLAQEKEPAA